MTRDGSRDASQNEIRKMEIRRNIFRGLVEAEREKQDLKWGQNVVGLHKLIVVMGDEFGEVCRGVLEFNNPRGPDKLEAELVQVAAVCSKFYELLEILETERIDRELEAKAHRTERAP